MGNIYDFRLMPDFGGGRAVIQDAYVSARFQPWFALQVGKFKGPVGLERLQADQWRRIVEAGFPTGLVPNRDIGVQLSGTVLNGTVSCAAGYFDGAVDGASTDANSTPDIDNDGKRDWEGHIFTLPFAHADRFALRGLGFGIGGTYVNSTGVATSATAGATTTSLLPTYRTPGQQTLFSYRSDTAGTPTVNEATIADGIRRRLAPQFYHYSGRFGLMGEYTEVTQQVRRQVDATTSRHGTLQHSAWQLTAAWFLTGEEESYGAFTQHSTFQPGRPGTGFRWQISYDVTRYDGGAATGDRPNERALLTRFGLVL